MAPRCDNSLSRAQVDTLTQNCATHGILAFGIGTSKVGMVLTTQCLLTHGWKSMLVSIHGSLQPCITAKGLALGVVRQLRIGGGTGHAIEFAGETIRRLTMESRMTLCNMVIQAGARAALVAVDDTTIAYIEGRLYAPRVPLWERAVAEGRSLRSDEGACFDATVTRDAASVQPGVTWGAADEPIVDRLFAAVEAMPGYRLTVDLPAQCLHTPDGESLSFPIDAFRKRCHIESLDDVAYALTHAEQIRAFEARRSTEATWVFGGFEVPEGEGLKD